MIYSNVSEVPNDIFSHDNASMTEYDCHCGDFFLNINRLLDDLRAVKNNLNVRHRHDASHLRVKSSYTMNSNKNGETPY